MTGTHSDALVFFGATGDLAYKKIFPALQAMLKRGNLEIPIIGVAKAGWNLDQFRARARESVERHGGLDRNAFDRLSRLLRYVDGDYHDVSTFQRIRRELGSCANPAFYLAIPPALFGLVVQHLGDSTCSKGARVIVEKPFGTDLASAQELNRILLGAFSESAIFRIDHYLGKQPVRNLLYFRFANLFPDALWNRANVESIQITMAEDFGVQGRGAFYDRTGAIRDVIQNHILQILSNLTMEPPARADSESVRDEKVKVLKAIAPIEARNVVRGQFRGYQNEPGVAAGSQTETFAALQLEVNSWRWRGVPIYIRAGKSMPISCTEILVRLRRPPDIYQTGELASNHIRFRISPDVAIALGMMVLSPDKDMVGQPVEMVAHHQPQANEMDAYERVLGEAVTGDTTLFARQDYVEEAWRIVDPVLRASTPVYPYEPGTWGPAEATPAVEPPGGWRVPVMTPSASGDDALRAHEEPVTA
jgi:glucose-6-phosphate 1-dehydrogenase